MTTLTDVLVDHLATRDPEEPGVRARARRIAVDIENRFHMIPAAECEPVEAEYLLPTELVEDGTVVEQVHARQAAELVAEAMRRGLVIINRPERYDLPPFDRSMAQHMKRFQLRAMGWRPPTKIASRSGESSLPSPPPRASGKGRGAPTKESGDGEACDPVPARGAQAVAATPRDRH